MNKILGNKLHNSSTQRETDTGEQQQSTIDNTFKVFVLGTL